MPRDRQTDRRTHTHTHPKDDEVGQGGTGKLPSGKAVKPFSQDLTNEEDFTLTIQQGFLEKARRKSQYQ